MPARPDGSRTAAAPEELPHALDRGRGSLVPRLEVVGADGCRCAGRDRGGDGVVARVDGSSLGRASTAWGGDRRAGGGKNQTPPLWPFFSPPPPPPAAKFLFYLPPDTAP